MNNVFTISVCRQNEKVATLCVLKQKESGFECHRDTTYLAPQFSFGASRMVKCYVFRIGVLAVDQSCQLG